MKPSEIADHIQRLFDLTADLTIEQIATDIGKSKRWVYDMYALRKLIPTAKEAADDGTIPLRNAFLLSRMKPAEQELVLEQAKTENGDAFAQTARRIRYRRVKPK